MSCYHIGIFTAVTLLVQAFVSTDIRGEDKLLLTAKSGTFACLTEEFAQNAFRMLGDTQVTEDKRRAQFLELVREGRCILLRPGDKLFVEGYRIGTGFARVSRPGGMVFWWTPLAGSLYHIEPSR